MDRKAQVKDDRLRVTVGTIRSKVSHKESEFFWYPWKQEAIVSMTAGACDLYTWGSGHRGMLGHKDEDDERVPRVVESLLGRDIVMAACGVAHTVALGGMYLDVFPAPPVSQSSHSHWRGVLLGLWILWPSGARELAGPIFSSNDRSSSQGPGSDVHCLS